MVVFKVAKMGFDIFKDEGKDAQNKVNNKSRSSNTYFYPVLALAYFYGAEEQLLRYKRALSSTRCIDSALISLHEVSCLLEDLETVGIYLNKCGETHKLNSLIKTMRDHVRHDLREQFDDYSDNRKIEKHENLEISSHLQTEMYFDLEYIRIGKKKLSINAIEQYLDWAWACMEEILDSALKKGYLKEKFW